MNPPHRDTDRAEAGFGEMGRDAAQRVTGFADQRLLMRVHDIEPNGLHIINGGGKADAKLDGYTPSQRFFISNALVWRSKVRMEFLKAAPRTELHVSVSQDRKSVV